MPKAARILVLADEPVKAYYEYYNEKTFEGIDLIISCGDLDPLYLSFLVTLSTVPVLYVHGNHDAKYKSRAPEGCICIDDCVYQYKLVVTGRLHNAVNDITYTILSNREEITFDQAWKASGLSSNMADYFDVEDLTFVGIQ